MYEEFTKYIEVLESRTEFGKADISKDSLFPNITYDEDIHDFLGELHQLPERNGELFKCYEYVEEYQAKVGVKDIREYDAEMLDAFTIFNFMTMVDAEERFYDGLILGCLNNGIFLKWIKRLKEIDKLSKQA
ncbi:hypothetical protein P261_02643 [Lachnospiraceae bacterium TWA4]|nr:hypothetical protein P261_02643 [Lachnospiraceae bacterium TWA4]